MEDKNEYNKTSETSTNTLSNTEVISIKDEQTISESTYVEKPYKVLKPVRVKFVGKIVND